MFRLLGFAFVLVLALFVLSAAPEVAHSPTYTREPIPPTELSSSTESVLEKSPPTDDTAEELQLPPEPQTEVVAPEKAVPPLPSPLEIARANAQRAVVNILCEPKANGRMAVSGTGVIIDPRGVIITNAHVAQYVLLSAREEVNLTCIIRTGSPAVKTWKTDILYIPREWVDEHAEDIIKTRPSGTGEDDYAFLIVRGLNDEAVGPLPFLPIETAIDTSVVGSTTVLSAYPAEFSGLAATQQFLLSSAILTPVRNILTFNANTIDVLSFGAVALAQGGSSGGAVVNGDGKLIAIISTTSDKEFIAERDLRGVSLSYIDRALKESLGIDLSTMLEGDVFAQSAQFRLNQAPGLAQQIINFLSQKQQ